MIFQKLAKTCSTKIYSSVHIHLIFKMSYEEKSYNQNEQYMAFTK